MMQCSGILKWVLCLLCLETQHELYDQLQGWYSLGQITYSVVYNKEDATL